MLTSIARLQLYFLVFLALTISVEAQPPLKERVILAASTQAYAAHVVAACRGFAVNAKELDNQLSKTGISLMDQKSDEYTKAISNWLHNHANDEVLCSYDYIYHGPDGISDHLFAVTDDEEGREAVARAQESGKGAAINFALAANGGHTCGLQVYQKDLDLFVTKDGMDSRLIAMLQGGSVPTHQAESNLNFKMQQKAWRDTLDGVSRERMTKLQYCQSIYNHFGPDGDIYPNVIAKPEIPYNPYQIR